MEFCAPARLRTKHAAEKESEESVLSSDDDDDEARRRSFFQLLNFTLYGTVPHHHNYCIPPRLGLKQ